MMTFGHIALRYLLDALGRQGHALDSTVSAEDIRRAGPPRVHVIAVNVSKADMASSWREPALRAAMDAIAASLKARRIVAFTGTIYRPIDRVNHETVSDPRTGTRLSVVDEPLCYSIGVLALEAEASHALVVSYGFGLQQSDAAKAGRVTL